MIKKMAKKMLKEINALFLQISGTTSYNKFIIISRSRSGSNLLLTKLDSHPNVEAKGAPFSNLNGNTTESIWRKVFSFKPKHIKSVGFKIFYYHPQDDENKEVWTIIKNDPTIKLIHLRRENKLKTYVSWQIAEQNNLWANAKNDTISKKKKSITVDKDDLMKVLDDTAKNEEKIETSFPEHQLLSLTYEELISNKEIDAKITEFLALPMHELKTFIKKQNKETIRELIVNFDELKEAFQQSKYAYLFELN